MRAVFLITLVAFGSFAQGRFDRVNKRTSQGRSTRGFEQSNYAFFEFAPSSGAGMGTACACTTPTGAKGEALTFTRAGAATCSKQGLATTGILNGDLVVCAGDQPRVEASGGVLGLRVEGARTNSVLRSQELENAAWADDVAGVAAITITANAATAPDGTATAERFQIPALPSASQYSLRRQAIAAGSTGNASIYVKGNGTSGSISLATDGSLATATDCAYVAATWTRCALGTIGAWFFVGAITTYGTTSGTKASQDVFVWGAQTEGSGVATYATSYIPTVAAGVTRNADRAYLTLASTPKGADGLYSMSATLETAYNVNRTWEALLLSTSGAAPYVSMLSNAAQNRCESNNGTSLTATGTASGPSGRLTCWNDGSNEQGINNGVAFSGPVAGIRSGVGINRLNVATGSAGYEIEGVITRVCVDPSPTRCR